MSSDEDERLPWEDNDPWKDKDFAVQIATGVGRGECITFQRVGDVLVPIVGEKLVEQLARMDEFVTRDDDVWICAYPKSGTNWTWGIIKMLEEQTTDITSWNKMISFLEVVDHDLINSMESPRLLNTHLPVSMMRAALTRTKCKVIYIYRNPKDAWVSYWHHCRNMLEYQYRGKWNGFFDLIKTANFEYGCWFDHVRKFHELGEELGPQRFLLLCYEDMKRDLGSNIRKIAEFLNLSASDSLIEQITEKATFKNMAPVANEHQNLEVWKDKKCKFLRKGQIGDWKNHFSEAQNKEFEEIFKEKAKDFPVPLYFTPDDQ